jgi:group I intron endonuclease
MKANTLHNKCGIYCIKNKINNKVYVGKSKNIYKRIISHISDLNKDNKRANRYLKSSWDKYGRDNFEYDVLEFMEENEELVAGRELFWIEKLKSSDRMFGYNLRTDSSTKMLTHPDTSILISKRLKKEWAEGLRDSHSKKLKENWIKNPERGLNQSKMFSEIKTKYSYNIYDINNLFIENCKYKRLKELGLANVFAKFSEKKKNKVPFKNNYVERVLIEDIVRSS